MDQGLAIDDVHVDKNMFLPSLLNEKSMNEVLKVNFGKRLLRQKVYCFQSALRTMVEKDDLIIASDCIPWQQINILAYLRQKMFAPNRKLPIAKPIFSNRNNSDHKSCFVIVVWAYVIISVNVDLSCRFTNFTLYFNFI